MFRSRLLLVLIRIALEPLLLTLTSHRSFGFSTNSTPAAANVIEASKQLAAYTAVDQHIKPEHTSKELIVNAGLTLGDVDQISAIDVTIDGADEVDKNLNSIKGGGACHLREKVVAEAASTFIVVADYRKNAEFLGTNWAPGVPVEVVPFAYVKVLRDLKALGSPHPVLRMAVKKAGPIVTDNGNFVIDAPFGREDMLDPAAVLTKIKLLTGVVEVGLFCNIVTAAYFGNADGSVSIRKADGIVEELAPSSS
ncbi:hypothetical protein C0989_004370 [Termitomyces sp. Mn162]|nr:hypothetical protein C0989_004370 [Termitomyces sp. Mn162]